MREPGEWFVIQTGPHKGTIHMSGWSYSAHLGNPTGHNDDGWLAYGTCPRCGVMVLSDEDHLSGEVMRHTAWHSNTDHHIPPEINAEQDRIYQALSRGD